MHSMDSYYVSKLIPLMAEAALHAARVQVAATEAAIEAATRPATISPPRTGPSSRTIPIATIEGTTASALNRAPPE